MYSLRMGIVVLLLALPAWGDDKPTNSSAPPGEQLKSLLKEHGAATKAYQDALREARTAAARDRLQKDLAPKPEKFVGRFLALAEKHPTDPSALDALIWVVTYTSQRSKNAPKEVGEIRTKALAALLKDHVQSPKMVQLITSLAAATDQPARDLFQAIQEKTPHAEIKAESLVSRARHARLQAGQARRAQRQADAGSIPAARIGADREADEALLKLDPKALDKEADALWHIVAEKHLPHLKTTSLLNLCRSFGFSQSRADRAVLTAIREKITNKEVLAEATLQLAHQMRNQVSLARRVLQDKELADRIAEIEGPAHVEELKKTDLTAIEQEADHLWREVADKHLANMRRENLVTLCRSLCASPRPQEQALLAVLREYTKEKEVQAAAWQATAQGLSRKVDQARELKKDSKFADRLATSYGKDYVEQLRKTDPAALEKESETLWRIVAEKYLTTAKEDNLISLCQSLSFGEDKASEIVPRTLLEKDERRQVKAVACLSLGQMLRRRGEAMPVSDLKEIAKIRKEAETLFERAIAEFGDEKSAFRGTIGERAKNDLYALRNLAVGMPAPDVEGEDQDGQKFRLSDYRGKVILLDFWSHT